MPNSINNNTDYNILQSESATTQEGSDLYAEFTTKVNQLEGKIKDTDDFLKYVLYGIGVTLLFGFIALVGILIDTVHYRIEDNRWHQEHSKSIREAIAPSSAPNQ